MNIEEAVRLAEPELMSKPNVVGVGQGERGGKPVIKVLVTRKAQRSELKAGDIIPETIQGFPTDVIETGVISAQGIE